MIERAIHEPKRTEKIRDVVIGNAMKALAKLPTLDARIAMARTWASFWDNERYTIDMATTISVLGSKVNEFVPLLHHQDPLVRIGAIRVLGFSTSRDALDELQAIEDQSCSQSDATLFDRLPFAARQHLMKDYRSSIRGNLSLEAYLAGISLSTLRPSIRRVDIESRWRLSIKSAMSNSAHSGLPDSLDDLELYKSWELIMFIIKSGLCHRSGKKWLVGGTYRGMWIKPSVSRRKNEDKYDKDHVELCGLLNMATVDSKIFIPTGYGNHNYWKEYIYRAWGVEPAILGSTDPVWD